MRKLISVLSGLALAMTLGLAAQAATPKDTLVAAYNIDDIITMDPAEVFELVGGEVIANIYDRVTMYESEDLETLVGGVAESWSISDDAKTITLKIRPGQKFHSGNPVTAADVEFSLERVILLEQTPVFIFNQFGWNKDNVADLVKVVDDMTVELTITEDLAPTLVLNCLAAGVGSVVDKMTVMANEKDGDLGHEWLKTHSAGSGPFSLKSWKANEAVILEANADYRHGAPAMKRVILRHVPEPAAQRLLLERATSTWRAT
jgi:peptide/nickel transport system substrate-binding protein